MSQFIHRAIRVDDDRSRMTINQSDSLSTSANQSDSLSTSTEVVKLSPRLTSTEVVKLSPRLTSTEVVKLSPRATRAIPLATADVTHPRSCLKNSFFQVATSIASLPQNFIRQYGLHPFTQSTLRAIRAPTPQCGLRRSTLQCGLRLIRQYGLRNLRCTSSTPTAPTQASLRKTRLFIRQHRLQNATQVDAQRGLQSRKPACKTQDRLTRVLRVFLTLSWCQFGTNHGVKRTRTRCQSDVMPGYPLAVSTWNHS